MADDEQVPVRGGDLLSTLLDGVLVAAWPIFLAEQTHRLCMPSARRTDSGAIGFEVPDRRTQENLPSGCNWRAWARHVKLDIMRRTQSGRRARPVRRSHAWLANAELGWEDWTVFEPRLSL